MKKYFIAVAAMAFLAACSGKQAQKDVPVEVEEEEFAIMSAAPDAPSLPLIHSVKATQPAKPVNMRDSLKADPKKGPVIQKKYKGTLTSPDSVNVDEEGVFELDALYTVPEAVASSTGAAKKAPQKAITTGKQKVKHGAPDDVSAVIYELIPSDGEPVIYFLVEGDNLTLMNDALQKAAADLNYTLKLVQ